MPPGALVSFELVVRYSPARQTSIDEEARRLLAGTRPAAREAAIANRSADPADIDRVCAVLARAGLTIDSIHSDARSIHVTGTAATVETLFGIRFRQCHRGAATWREYDGPVRMPPELAGLVEPLGLSTRPIAEA